MALHHACDRKTPGSSKSTDWEVCPPSAWSFLSSWADPGSTPTYSAGSVLAQCRINREEIEPILGRRRPNINPTLGQCLVIAGKAWVMTQGIELIGWRTWWRPHWEKIFQSIWWRLQYDVSSLWKMCHSWHELMASVRLKLSQLRMCQNCTWRQGSVIHTILAANVSNTICAIIWRN